MLDNVKQGVKLFSLFYHLSNRTFVYRYWCRISESPPYRQGVTPSHLFISKKKISSWFEDALAVFKKAWKSFLKKSGLTNLVNRS